MIIIHANEDNSLGVIAPSAETQNALDDLAMSILGQRPYKIVDSSVFPSNRLFSEAWEFDGKGISTNVGKARLIAHKVRRNKRAEEFAPLDVQATIPAKAAEAEAERQKIRDKYATFQERLDAAMDADTLLEIVEEILQ